MKEKIAKSIGFEIGHLRGKIGNEVKSSKVCSPCAFKFSSLWNKYFRKDLSKFALKG